MMTKPVDMVEQLHQWWQADAKAGDVAGAQQQETEQQPDPEHQEQQEAEQSPQDIFSSMFAELSKEDDEGGKKDAPAAGAPDGKAPAGADGGDGGGQPGDDADGAGAGGDGDGLPDPAKVAADAKKNQEQQPTEQRQPTEQKDGKAPKGDDKGPVSLTFEQLRELVKPTDKPADQSQQQQDQGYKGPEYTKDEQGLIEAYQKEWPEIAAAEQLMRREEQKGLAYYIFSEISRHYGPLLQQLMTHARGTTQSTHLAALQQAVPDYDEVRDQVISWVDGQPEGLKAAYKAVVQDGSPEDIVGLIQHWRTVTGYKAPPTPSAPAPGTPPAAQRQPPQRVLNNLKPPASRRSSVQTGVVDKNDFENAFDAAVADKTI